MNYMKMPITVNFELTYSCNAKCKFCSIKNNIQSNFVDITKIKDLIDIFDQNEIIIFKLFFKNIVINNLILYLAWTICIDIVFANIGILLGLFSKNWNSVAAVQDYIVSPVMYLSGCFFSINQVPDLVKRFVQINPIFHFFNISNYLFSGQAEYDLRISFLMCISIAILSTMVCYVIFKKGYGLLK